MVFESLVADLLNKFLGDFVDNLDASQLNIGIWGGGIFLPLTFSLLHPLNHLRRRKTAHPGDKGDRLR